MGNDTLGLVVKDRIAGDGCNRGLAISIVESFMAADDGLKKKVSFLAWRSISGREERR